MENKAPFVVHKMDLNNPDKRIKNLILPGPTPDSVPELWAEYEGRIFVIFFTPGPPVEPNLYAFNGQGQLLWKAPGGLEGLWRDAYVSLYWSDEHQHLGSHLYGGGGVILDEKTGEIVDRWAGR